MLNRTNGKRLVESWSTWHCCLKGIPWYQTKVPRCSVPHTTAKIVGKYNSKIAKLKVANFNNLKLYFVTEIKVEWGSKLNGEGEGEGEGGEEGLSLTLRF